MFSESGVGLTKFELPGGRLLDETTAQVEGSS